MQRLLSYIFQQWIDSYYLLIIKFDMSDLAHIAYFVDLLDWTDFIAYDAGPGQIMLRERDFYAAYDSGHIPAKRDMLAKAEALFSLSERKLHDLFANRQERLQRQRDSLDKFRETDFVVDQSEMRFVL